MLWSLFLTVSQAALALATGLPYPPQFPPKVVNTSIAFQFNSSTAWIENLAARSNGELVITRQDTPQLWTVNPHTHTAALSHTFLNATSVFGIDEYAPDIFAVATGNIELLPVLRGVPGSFNVWSVNFNKKLPAVEPIVGIKEAIFLNDLTALDEHSNRLLIADSQAGLVWAVDVKAKTYKVAIADAPTMAPQAGQLFPLGVNGVRVFKNWLYYTSDGTQNVYRVLISQLNGLATGKPEIFAPSITPGDFAVDYRGDLYVTTHPSNSLEYIPTTGGPGQVILGGLNQTILAGATSAVFGRTSKNTNVLYVCTSGGKPVVNNPSLLEPGKIVAVELQKGVSGYQG